MTSNSSANAMLVTSMTGWPYDATTSDRTMVFELSKKCAAE
jgi:hypothetical protein